MGSWLSEGSQGPSTPGHPGPAAPSACTTPGRPAVTGPGVRTQGPAGRRCPARPQAWRPSLCPEGQQQTWGQTGRGGGPDPAPPRPLCSAAPSPVPTLGAPGVTQAQRLREEGPHPVQAGTWGHWLPRPQEGPVTGLQGRGVGGGYGGPACPQTRDASQDAEPSASSVQPPGATLGWAPQIAPGLPTAHGATLPTHSSPSGNAPGPPEPNPGPSTWLLGDLGTWGPGPP